MRNKFLAGLAVGVMTFGITGVANATLIELGAVNYAGADRQLIYDDDLDITWLDYSNAPDSQIGQRIWADNLNLAINGTDYDDWRLPSVGEIKHLFLTELGNGVYEGSGLFSWNSGPFTSINMWTTAWSGDWYGSEHGGLGGAWLDIYSGADVDPPNYISLGAIAIRPGRIDTPNPTPEPATMLLMGTGLAGLVGARRKKNR